MENQSHNTSDDDLLKVFDTETTTSNVTSITCSTSIGGAAVTDNLSNILGEINPNNYQEDELLQILNTNSGQRPSHRRSSILKVTEKIAEFRRTSRRVSWAQTYQYKQLQSDGTTVICSQELNGPEPPPLPSGGRRSSEFEPSTITNENVEPSSQEGPLSAMTAPLLSSDPHQEHVLRKVKGKKRESFTRILSKFYNKDNEKDCQTVINTAVNRFGIDPTATDINGILDPANPNRTELLKNSENATLTGFLQEFAEQQQPVPPVAKAAVVTEAPVSKLPVISPISSNIKTSLHVIDDTMNMSTYQQVCNSTRVPGDQDLSDQFWKSALKETSAKDESIRQERGTIHETTMMDMDLDSSESNDKISKQSAVASVTNQTEEDTKQKEENEFLALLKGDAEDPSEMATDTFEFSFQLPQTSAPTAAETAQMTQGLTSILADVHKPEAALNETEVSTQSPEKSEVVVQQSPMKSSPKVNNKPPTPKRPYDFTLLDSDQVVEQQLKFAKQLGVSSTASALRTSTAFPSVSVPISRSRIPVLPGFQQRPAVGASVVILRGLGSAQPKPSQPLQPLNPSEVDFNQSANSTSSNDSGDDSSELDSPIATRIKENCIRKSIGFGMRDRLIEKAKQLNIQRKQATVLLTTRTVEEVPLLEPPQATEAPSRPVDDSEAGVAMSISSPVNFTMTDMSLDSIKFNDDFDDELDNSDTSSITVFGQQRTSLDLKNLIEEASQSIANVYILSFSDGDTSEKKEELESTLSVTEMPLNETLGMFLNQSLNLTKNFSDDPFSDSLTAEWLEEYKAETAGNTLYRCISTLDFNSMHIRIHEMNADSCMVRFLWGTLEVRINFGTAKTEGAPRPMTFYNSTQLLTNKPIPYEVMRGLTDLAKYDSDELFMSFDEEHRPFLNLAHSYVNTRFHEEYHELLKKYPDSSKLADLLADLANIVETARKLCVELQHMYEREFMEVMPPEDDCFKFKVKLLGVRLVSHFYLEFAFNSMKYPYEVIRPKIIVPPQDQHLYPIDQFKAALLMVKPGNYNYLEGLVKGAQFFVAALRKVLLRNLMYQKQKAELEGGVHLVYSPAYNTTATS